MKRTSGSGTMTRAGETCRAFTSGSCDTLDDHEERAGIKCGHADQLASAYGHVRPDPKQALSLGERDLAKLTQGGSC